MATTTLINVPLGSLRSGAKAGINPRKAKAPIEGLMRSIDAHGLILPLLVRKNGADAWDVMDGNRRLAALLEIAKRDKIAGKLQVPCVETVDGKPVELAMVVNVERVNLHPVDQFEVFAALVQSGHKVDALAQKYGLKLAQVRQALALGRMAPEVRDAWRDGAINAETAEAFLVTSDHKAQAAALKRVGKHGGAWQVKRTLLGEGRERSPEDLLKFVGRAAYEKAGGEVNATLFSEQDGGVQVSDRAKLVEMVRRKLSDTCDKLTKEGWKWAVPADDAPKDARSWRRVTKSNYSKAEMATLGCIVGLDPYDGKLSVSRGVAKPGDAVPTPKVASPAEKKKAAAEKAKRRAETGGVSNTLARDLSRQFEEAVRDVIEEIDAGKEHPLMIHLDARQVATLVPDAMRKVLLKTFDAANYFSRLDREATLAALKEMKAPLPKPEAKKAVLVASAASAAKAKAWLPPLLRIGK